MSGTSYANSTAYVGQVQGPSRGNEQQVMSKIQSQSCCFQMPLHYPRYKKSNYENMPEWKLDCLLKEYGLPVHGDVSHKRNFAMGAFLWPSEY